ncbi:hypothetical protein SR39_01220 [Methylobacterium radiotolerans]|jgi:hypothetical protein|nr:hypothetical protein SR39_01220 [Methylobacterium radiotolerans]
MGMTIGTGWLAKQEAAKAALAKRNNGHHPIADDPISQARKAMLDAQAEATRLAQEAAEALILSTVSVCPCCSGRGHVAVPDAAKVVEALRRYDFVGWKPDAQTIADLMRTAITVDRDGNPVSETNKVATSESAPVMTTADDAAGSDAEALAAIEAETARSAKTPRRRVPPLPFLDGDA